MDVGSAQWGVFGLARVTSVWRRCDACSRSAGAGQGGSRHRLALASSQQMHVPHVSWARDLSAKEPVRQYPVRRGGADRADCMARPEAPPCPVNRAPRLAMACLGNHAAPPPAKKHVIGTPGNLRRQCRKICARTLGASQLFIYPAVLASSHPAACAEVGCWMCREWHGRVRAGLSAARRSGD